MMIPGVRYRPTTSDERCGKPTKAKRACRLKRMHGFDGCERHRTVSPDQLLIEATKRRMDAETCAELHSSLGRLGYTHRWLRHMELFEEWVDGFHPRDVAPACWSWDASAAAVADVRQQVLRWRVERAPAGASEEELRRALDWEVLIEWHRHRCAMCGEVIKLEMDHCHETGYLRGLLCHGCNFHEGYHSEWRTRLSFASYRFGTPSLLCARYRAKNPATILGVQWRYSSRYAFPAWSRLAEQPSVGTAPEHVLAEAAARREQDAINARPADWLEQARARADADRRERRFKEEVHSLQMASLGSPCWVCTHRPWTAFQERAAAVPVAEWVRHRFPGLHEETVARQAPHFAVIDAYAARQRAGSPQ